MAEISLSIPSLPDILSPIIDPPVESPDTPTITAPPDTVTVTADPSSSTSSITRSSSTSSVTSRSQSSAPVSTSSSATSAENSTATEPPEFLTTTYITQEGTSLITVTSLITNPGRTHSNPALNNFFSNKAAVIGVFTACAIVGFACIIALIAWIARRRTLKRWEREESEKQSFDRRNFLQDEMQDELDPSEKSWWASGTSIIPDGMPMQNPHSLPYPPLQQTDLSPVATTFGGSTESKGAAESIGPISHPYGGSVVSEPYHLTSPRAQHGSLASISSVRDVARSPPPSVPYRGQDSSHLSIIMEGPPSGPLSRKASHPYASPPTNRKSELYAEDVLLDLGSKGGVGRSLSGSRPVPAKGDTLLIRKASQDGGSQGQGFIGHHGSSLQPGLGNISESGPSDGAWQYDSNPFNGAEPALAPTEVVVQKRMVPHDPRFSGLFGTGTWAANRQSDSMGTEDEYLGGSSPRVLRVTNE